MKAVVFAVPGNLATPTGGYVYDRRLLTELMALGWHTEAVTLGDGFPFPTAEIRAAACARLAALPRRHPIVIDGLAFGALPEAGEALRRSHRLVALVHHPLALETGLSTADCAQLLESERAALGGARHVVASSKTTARMLVADYGVQPERVTVVEPGTDRMPSRRRSGNGEAALLAVGAVIPRKGYDVLIAALAQLRDLPWRLAIAGDLGRSPDTAHRLESDVAELGLVDKIKFMGAVSQEQLAELYTDCDLFVLPSRFEGYGMAYAEAIARGVPVVGTTAGAIPETVPSAAAVLLPPDDVGALATALRRLITSPAERERLAAAARNAVFPSWPEQAAQFARVLESLG